MRAWILAARPPTLWAAVAPVLVGSALAVSAEVFRFDAFLVVLIAAVAIQIGVNFANDLADAERGADTEERIGPQRAVASGLISANRMRAATAFVFGIAAGCGLYLAWLAGWVILVIGVLSILAALGYTAGPYPYGYHGFGEVFVFVFFGLVATVGTRYVYDQTAPAEAWWCGVAMGSLAAAILVANNVRDIDTDGEAGKNTLAVKLGRRGAGRLYAGLVGGAFVVVVLAVASDVLMLSALLALLALPLAVRPIRVVTTETAGPPLIQALKDTARLQLAVAVLLSVGILLGA